MAIRNRDCFWNFFLSVSAALYVATVSGEPGKLQNNTPRVCKSFYPPPRSVIFSGYLLPSVRGLRKNILTNGVMSARADHPLPVLARASITPACLSAGERLYCQAVERRTVGTFGHFSAIIEELRRRDGFSEINSARVHVSFDSTTRRTRASTTIHS